MLPDRYPSEGKLLACASVQECHPKDADAVPARLIRIGIGADNGRVMEALSQDDALAAVAWLAEWAGQAFTGYDATGWEAKVWIPHAMYETDQIPGGISHDDVHRIERAAGATEPVMLGEVELEELLKDATVVGSVPGASRWPGPGWHRLLWSELATRLGVDPYELDVPPSLRSFPYSSWPANIEPPAEGSLDREQFVQMLDVLADLTAEGPEAMCTAYFSPLASGDFESKTIFRCNLYQLIELYDDENLSGSPNNIWPDDRSWFTLTDEDLWATKVSGSRNLIGRLLDVADLETVVLDF
jgi:hypothetical protein